MANENATIDKKDSYEGLDFEALEEQLQSELESQMSDLELLDDQIEKIGSPDALGEVVLSTVWEQFANQVAVRAGEDFIRDNMDLINRGNTMDRSAPITKADAKKYGLNLSNEAHIQTTDNFANGVIATHNTEIDYQTRYDDWQNNFQRNADGSLKTRVDNRTGEDKAVLRVKDKKKDPSGENYNTNYDAREFIDKGRPKGSKTVHKDHTISAAEIIRDPEAAAHMTREEQADFANSDVNLVDLDSRANESKGDSTMSEWLDSERNGEKPAERFPIDEEELRKRDEEARKEYEKQKKVAEKRSIEAGRKSQKAEALRIGKKATRAVVMNLLADLVKKIIQKLISWLKSADKNLKSLLTYIKDAIVSFVVDLKNTVVNVVDTAITVIATSIIGPVVSTIKKAWMFIKQGWASLKQAVEYIRNPQNRNKPFGILMMEVGKIIMAGVTAAGAIVLGEVIEKGLSTIPIFALDIPLFGSLANIIGIFMGSLISGIIGALAINLLNSLIEKRQKAELTKDKVDKGNEILATQEKMMDLSVKKYDKAKTEAVNSISKRHQEAAGIMKESIEVIKENSEADYEDIDNHDDFAEIDRRLSDLED